MLTKNEFSVLSLLEREAPLSQRQLGAKTGLSLGSINSALKSLERKGFIEHGVVTPDGLQALNPYQVDNAVIMAAGLSSRFAPISYEKPKGLLKVKGEVLIERQIRQLKAAGIHDIIVVVGYKKEYFFYLEDAFGVKIVVNEEFASRNNHSSLMVVKDHLRNTFVCSSDDYFTSNPFEPYVWKAYYATQFKSGPTREWCIKTGAGKRIVSVEVGGEDSWIMLGHVYFDRDFSHRFARILQEEYDYPETADKLWEELYVGHIKQLDMTMRPYADGVINEFDTLDELRAFDPRFLENVDSEVFDNIVGVLGCAKDEICDVYPLVQGLTNLSCHFKTKGGEYVYRHPGAGTEYLIDRKAEVAAQAVAKELGLDNTFIYEDPRKGWKISRFIARCSLLDPHDRSQVCRAMKVARVLHDSSASVDRTFDFYQEGQRYVDLLQERGPLDIPDLQEMHDKARQVKSFADADGARVCLTHNDFFALNLLFDEHDDMHLIDWEYAGMSDYAHDFGTFVVCCQLTHDEALFALESYFGRPPTQREIRHNFAYVALAGWCWYLWSLMKETEGDIVGEWLYIYYRYAKTYLDKILAWYGREARQGDRP